MNEKINVLMVEPGQAPRMDSIPNDSDAFERIVGGSYDVGIFLSHEAAIIYCEANKLRGAVPNRLLPHANGYIAGTFFLCGIDSKGFCSLPADQQRMFEEHYAMNPPFFLIGDRRKTICTSAGDLAKAACILWENMKAGQSIRISRWGGSAI